MEDLIRSDKKSSNINIPLYNSKNDNKYIDTLIIGSGGVSGVVYPGALKSFENFGLLKNIKHIYGISSGAIICSLYVIGYTPDELIKISSELNFKKLVSISFKNIYSGFFDDGKKLENVLKKFLVYKNFNPYITMKELYKITNKKLSIIVYNHTLCKKETINYITFPNISLIKAIRMSSAIPLFFKSIEHNGYLYMDGAIAQSFPIQHISDPKKTIGIKINHLNPQTNSQEEINISKNKKYINLYNNIEKSISALLNSNNLREKYECIKRKEYYIELNTNINTFDFDKSKEFKISEIRNAYLQTIKYCLKRFI